MNVSILEYGLPVDFLRYVALVLRLQIDAPFDGVFEAASSSSATVVVKNWEAGFWKTVAVRSPERSIGAEDTSSSSMRTRPLSSPSWKFGMRPLSRRRTVDLPEPETPHTRVRAPEDFSYVKTMRLLVSLFAARLQERRLLDEGEVQELLQGFLAELPMLLAQNLQKCA